MKLETRIDEAGGLCGDIERDLAQAKSLCGARKPERSLDYLTHIQDFLLDELHDHIVALREHYARQVEKAGRR